MMRTLFGIVAMLIALVAAAARAESDPSSHRKPWLMLVATKNLDLAKEDAFNHWYDDIDIPDVLKVPGYRRARRGLRHTVAGFSSPAVENEDGRYVALYDIDTSNIDRTIVDMMLAAKKMDMTGRSIDALKVTERVYFRPLVEAINVTTPMPAGAKQTGVRTFVYLERVACCRDEATVNAFNDWYDTTRIVDAGRLGESGLRGIARYEVYRVAMVELLQVPRFLTLYEFQADSAEQVVDAMRRLNDRMRAVDHSNEWFVESGSAVFEITKDVRR
jgi:hypothetical protein